MTECDNLKIVKLYFNSIRGKHKQQEVKDHIGQCKKCRAKLAALSATFDNLATRCK